jgi:hypothetical protein
MVKIISRLSKNSGLYPQSLLIRDLQISGTLAVGGGTYGDIFKGHVFGDTVAVKVMRVFGPRADFSKLNKVSTTFILHAVLHQIFPLAICARSYYLAPDVPSQYSTLSWHPHYGI